MPVQSAPAIVTLVVEEEVQLETPTGTLHGTLLYPVDRGPLPVVLLIAGSGPTDRNGNSVGLPGANNSLMLLAEALAERGIATLRYDKRGVSDLRPHLPKDFCRQAADLLAARPGVALITTGFYILRTGTPETDGPPGAVAIGRKAPLAMIGSIQKPVAFESAELFRWLGEEVHGSLKDPYQSITRAGALTEVDPGSQAAFLMRTMDVFVEARVTLPPDAYVDVFVDRGSATTACSDAGRDGTRAKPFCSIQTGIDHARSLAGSADPSAPRLIFNDYLNSALAITFMVVVALVIIAAAREWYLTLWGKKEPVLQEAPFVQSAYAAGD